MNKTFSISMILCCILFTGVGFVSAVETVKGEDYTVSSASALPLAPVEKEGDDEFAQRVGKVADTTSSKLDEFTAQLDRVLDVLLEKYKEISPKLKKIGEVIGEKIEKFKASSKEDTPEEPSVPKAPLQ